MTYFLERQHTGHLRGEFPHGNIWLPGRVSEATLGWAREAEDPTQRVTLEHFRKEVVELRRQLQDIQRHLALITVHGQNLQIDDEEAGNLISAHLDRVVGEGKGRVGLLSLIAATRLPSDQIERVMEKLRSEGVEPVDDE